MFLNKKGFKLEIIYIIKCPHPHPTRIYVCKQKTHFKISPELVGKSHSTQKIMKEELSKTKEVWRKEIQILRAKNNLKQKSKQNQRSSLFKN